MKKLFEKHFERTWLIIFLIMFVLIMIPFPFFYQTKRYIPAFGGVPLYIFGWIVHTVHYICADYCLLSHVYEEEKNITLMMRRTNK